MQLYYVKKGFHILKKKGIIELLHESKKFVINKLKKPVKFKLNTNKNKIYNNVLYDAPPNPQSPIYVNANSINHRMKGLSTPDNGLGKIKDGDWDRETNLESIEHNSQTYQGIRERFEKNMGWDETVYYKKLKQKNKNDAEIRKRCKYVEHLYYDIKNNGYRRANEESNKRFRRGYGQYLDVLVVIDRNGNIYHQGKGGHRLAIAKLLNKDIPVQVLIRHKNWQKLRDDLFNNRMPSSKFQKIQEHPDLQDIIY